MVLLNYVKIKSIIKTLCLLSMLFIGVWACYKDSQNETETGGTGTVTRGWNKAIIETDIKNDILNYMGVCYSKDTQEPTIDNKTACFENGLATLDNLDETTTYYWRAFIQKDGITKYDNAVQSFTTLERPTILTSVADVTCNSATLCGTINQLYTEIGISYYISQNPQPTSENMVSVSNSGNFEKNVNLDTVKNYSVRAYIINSIGEVVDGNTMSFTTLTPYPPEVATGGYKKDTISKQLFLYGQITDVGCPVCHEAGICWYFNGQEIRIPANNIENNIFSVSIKGGITQHVEYCAYAINSVGIKRGKKAYYKP